MARMFDCCVVCRARRAPCRCVCVCFLLSVERGSGVGTERDGPALGASGWCTWDVHLPCVCRAGRDDCALASGLCLASRLCGSMEMSQSTPRSPGPGLEAR
eukprot:7014642-Prymnesium_polylepis.1